MLIFFFTIHQQGSLNVLPGRGSCFPCHDEQLSNSDNQQRPAESLVQIPRPCENCRTTSGAVPRRLLCRVLSGSALIS
jgi:hypothetical protein